MIAGGRGASAAFAQAQARLRADRRFQFDFQGAAARSPEPAWVTWLERVLRQIAPVMPYVFWTVLGGTVLFVLVLVGREVMRQRGVGGGAPKVLDASGLQLSRARVRALLAEADRLAGEGRFGEAVRVLLMRTFDEIDARRPGLIGPAQTSREVAALDALPPAVRQPLSRIAHAVELFVFAGRPLDAPAFAACRAEYARFIEAASAA